MQNFLLSLLPWTKREWSDFLADLAPLLGLFIFASEPRNIMIAHYPELYFVFGYGMLRLITTAFFAAILLSALICIIMLLVGFIFFFYMMIELFLSVATTGGLEVNFIFLNIYNSLEPKEQYYILGIFLFTLYRYLPKIFVFFKTKPYKNYKNSWAWVALGTPEIPKHNQFQRMTNAFRTMVGIENNPSDIWEYTPAFYIGFLFFYFGVLVLMIKFPLFGPILTLVIKAFVEMYFFRLHKEAQGIAA